MAKTKQERDAYRYENVKLRQHAGIVNSDILTNDYESRSVRLKNLNNTILNLKNKHKLANMYLKKTHYKIQSYDLTPSAHTTTFLSKRRRQGNGRR